MSGVGAPTQAMDQVSLGRRSLFALPVALPLVAASACLPAAPARAFSQGLGLRSLPDNVKLCRIVIDHREGLRVLGEATAMLEKHEADRADRSLLLNYVGG